MKKLLSMMMVLALVFSCASVLAESKGTLVMGTNAEFPPYEYHDEVDGEDAIVGIDAEIADAICKYLGYVLQIDDMQFDSIIPAIQSGKIDFGMAGMTVTEERKLSVAFSTSYVTGVQVVIVKEGSEIATVDDLSKGGYIIGVQQATTGDLYCTWDLEDEGLATVERYNKGADAVAALVSGKVDCVVIDNEPAKEFVAVNEGLVILDTQYAVEDYAIAVSLENEELLASINEALAALTEDGTVQAIIDKYINNGEEEAVQE